MAFQPPVGPSVVVFVGILVAVVLAFLSGVYVASVRTGGPALRRAVLAAAGTAVVLGLLCLLVKSAAASPAPASRLMALVAASNTMGLLLGLSPVGRWLATGISIPALIAFQSFRLPLELVLHEWARQGSIPETMTWTGANFDVVTGVVALVAAPWAKRSRAVAWIANGIGLVLLVNVMRVAVLSSPLPVAWPLARPLLLAYHLPYALIVPICVAGALAGHVVLTRALLRHGPTPSAHRRVGASTATPSKRGVHEDE